MRMYYSLQEKRQIDLISDTCSYKEWMGRKGDDNLCALHSDGFYVFLDPSRIDISDEYAVVDPYTVAENINGEFHQRRFNSTLDLLKRYCNVDKPKILDLGCGEGHLTEVVKRANEDYDVYGLDYSISAIQYAKVHFDNIDFIVADGYEPPYPDEYFDVVLCNNIWEHVPDPMRMLSGITRIMKTGGIVIITTPSRYRFGNILRILCGIGTKFVSKLHVTEYSVGQVKEQLSFGGYEVLEAYSPSIREKNLFFTMLKKGIGFMLKVLRSKHVIEATVFYCAKKVDS